VPLEYLNGSAALIDPLLITERRSMLPRADRRLCGDGAGGAIAAVAATMRPRFAPMVWTASVDLDAARDGKAAPVYKDGLRIRWFCCDTMNVGIDAASSGSKLRPRSGER